MQGQAGEKGAVGAAELWAWILATQTHCPAQHCHHAGTDSVDVQDAWTFYAAMQGHAEEGGDMVWLSPGHASPVTVTYRGFYLSCAINTLGSLVRLICCMSALCTAVQDMLLQILVMPALHGNSITCLCNIAMLSSAWAT